MVSAHIPTPTPRIRTTNPHNPGVPRSKKISPPSDPEVALCLGTYGDPMGVGVPYEPGTSVGEVDERVAVYPAHPSSFPFLADIC